jgi:hypothetical protein
MHGWGMRDGDLLGGHQRNDKLGDGNLQDGHLRGSYLASCTFARSPVRLSRSPWKPVR